MNSAPDSPVLSSPETTVAGLWQRHANAVFLYGAAAVWAAPSFVNLARQSWSTESGAQSAIILATGIWLLFRELRHSPESAGDGRLLIALPWLACILILHLVAQLADILIIEMVAVFAAGVILLYLRGGGVLIRRLWFALLYLAVALPLPSAVVTPATQGLKLLAADLSVRLLAAMGFEVARSGASIFIDQYELLVEAACSGMNSIFSLVAIGMLYAYLRHRDAPLRAILVVVTAIPIAILANIVRVVVLVALVHWFGADILETALHSGTGLMLFLIALAALFGMDGLMDLAGYVGQRLTGVKAPE